MIQLLPKQFMDEDYDSCNLNTVAILKVDKIKIPLCDGCVTNLIRDLFLFNDKIFCYNCEYFIMSKSGWNFGGNCRRNERIESGDTDTGYNNHVECMQSCEYAEKRKDNIHNTDLTNVDYILPYRLEEFMRKNNINQTQLAEKSGVSYASLNKYVNGINIPSIITIMQLAKALECKVDDLLY